MVDECCGGTGGGCDCGCGHGRPIEDGGATLDAGELDLMAEGDGPTGPPPSLSGPEWEAWAEDVLGDVDHDTDLGKELARDALRIADGELSKAEFHERYRDEVEAEFGIDERPTKDEWAKSDGPSPRVPQVGGPSEETRRNVLKALGGAAAAGATAGLAGCLGAADPGDGEADDGVPATTDAEDETVGDPDRDVQMGMTIDTDACIACLQCSLACKEENDTDRGVHWPYVFRYEDEQYGETRQGELTRHCQHCSEASCTWVCPTQARYKRTEDGVVLTDYDTCVGCKYCQVACPYGVNYLGKDQPTDVSDGFEGPRESRNGRTVGGPPPKGVMGKCTFCVHRQDGDDPDLQGTTACEQRCPVDAIHFGDMNDPDSDPRQYIRGEFEGREDVEDKNQFKLLDEVGNEPNIVFVGRRPSQRARPIQGPTAYEDHGMVDGAYDYVEGGDDE